MKNLLKLLPVVVVLLAQPALAWRHGLVVVQTTPVPPAALTQGFTSNTLATPTWSSSNNTVDLACTNTLPTFQWSPNAYFPSAPNGTIWKPPGGFTSSCLSSANYTFSGGVLTMGANNAFANIMSCAWNGTTVVGETFGGGMYAEAQMKFVTPAPGGSASSPSFWGNSVQPFLGVSSPYVEIAPLEACCVTSAMNSHIHEWGATSTSPTGQGLQDLGAAITATFGAFNFNVMHKFAMLWVPASLNGGVGVFDTYVDDIFLTRQSYSFSGGPAPTLSGSSPTGGLSEADTQQFCLILQSGQLWPASFGPVNVWQLPAGLALRAPGSTVVQSGTATPVGGFGFADRASTSATTYSLNLSDTAGVFTATGTGVSGSGTTSLTINSTLPNVLAALSTLTLTASATDTITMTGTNSLGHTGTSQTTPVTISTTTAFDPVNKGSSITISNGNLTATPNTAATNYFLARSLTNHALGSTGKFYFEAALAETGTGSIAYGLCNSSAPTASSAPALTGGGTSTNVAAAYSNATNGVFINNTGSGASPSLVTGHTVGIAVDFSAKLIWIRDIAVPGTWNAGGTANPATGVGGITVAALAAGNYYACLYQFNNTTAGGSVTANFGATSYAATIPSGFSNW